MSLMFEVGGSSDSQAGNRAVVETVIRSCSGSDKHHEAVHLPKKIGFPGKAAKTPGDIFQYSIWERVRAA